MVERYASRLNAVFGSLSDPTRRDILKRVSAGEKSVGEIAQHYELSFAGVAKHLSVLEHAGLVKKTRHGKEQIVAIVPESLTTASEYLEAYREHWEVRLDSLDRYLQSNVKNKKNTYGRSKRS